MGHFRDLRSLGLAGVRMSSCVFRCNARRAACRPVCMGAVAVLTRAFLTWSYAGTFRFSVDRGNGADIVTRGLTTATRGRRRAGTAIAALLLVAAMTGCSTSADRVPSSAAIPTHSLRSDPRQAAVDQPATSQPAPGTVVHQTLSTPGASQIAAHAATARQLAAGRWTRLPAAPIGGRRGAAITWTGEEMLIWGGSRPDQRLTTDGAAYNPQTSRWRVLPRSPLEARSDMSSVWTGSTWFIWGGYRGAAGPKSVDGATYTPGTNTWRLLPPSPIKITSDNEQVQTVWTGTNVVVVAVATEASHATESPVTTASYDPDTNSWSSDPDLVLPQHHPAAELQLAAGGGHLYLWSQWNYNANGFGYSGTDTFSMDSSVHTWKPIHLDRAGNSGIASPIWTGEDFIQGATPAWRGFNAGPPQINLTGQRFNPATAQESTISHGPLDDLDPQNVWTGGALVALDLLATTSPDGHHAHPGRAAAWDPARNSWTPLSALPLTSDDNPQGVWAGTRLLIWGQFYDSPTVEDPSPGRPAAVGLQFTPGNG